MTKNWKVTALLLALCLMATASWAQPVPITIGTASIGGTNYPTGIAMAKIWNEHVPNVKAVAIATAGGIQNIDMLRTEDVQAGILRSVDAYRAIHGQEVWADEPLPWIRALTGGVMLDLKQVVALKSANIKTIADFKGKKIAVGPIGSSAEIDAREILAAYDLDYKSVTPEYVEVAQAVDMIQDGLIEGAIFGLSPGASAVAELMVTGKAIVLPISPEAVAKMRTLNPFIQEAVLPANVYPNQDYDVITAGDPPDVIGVREDMPEELAYQLTKALYENAQVMRDVAAAVAQFGPGLVIPEDKAMVPYHPGSLKYFKEAGILKGP